jgi:cytochrome P450
MEEKLIASREYDLLSPEVLDDPYRFYAYLRDNAPVCEVSDTGVYLVSKGSLIEEALERHGDFSANLTGVLIRGPDGRPQVFDLTGFGSAVDAIANADEPSHGIHRRLILPHVMPSVVASLEDELREWADDLMRPLLEAGRGDWIESVANPLPAMAMARVVGLPVEDARRLVDWAMTGTEILAGTTTLERLGPVGAKTAELSAYLATHLRRALADCGDGPATDVIGGLARAVRDGVIEEGTAISILVVLAGAGGESTSSLTGSAVRLLAEDAALQIQLRASPALIPAFVEEVVRTESPFRGHYRVVKRDTRLGGVELPKGSRVILLWAAANRDPEVFEDPDVIDVHRPNPRAHLGFGKGIHFCVGARLARLEGRVILEELLERTRSFELDPERPPRYVQSIFVRRHAELELILHT